MTRVSSDADTEDWEKVAEERANMLAQHYAQVLSDFEEMHNRQMEYGEKKVVLWDIVLSMKSRAEYDECFTRFFERTLGQRERGLLNAIEQMATAIWG